MSTILTARGISVHFGGVVALDRVDLDIERGAIHGLIGPNGAGKTTLINILSGLIPPTSGSLSVDGVSGGPWSVARTVENGLVRTFQQTRAFLGLTVAENFRIAAVSSGSAIDMEIIEAFDLHPLMKETAGDLSYAFLRRLGIALALSLHPKVLLLDEPAVGLTSHDLDRMASIIRARNARGVTILLVEHNMKFLMSLATRVTVLAQGRVLFEGSPEKCQSNPLVIETYLGTEAEHA